MGTVQTVPDLLRARAAVDGACPAYLVSPDVKLSVGELDDRADRIAIGLLVDGLAVGDRVALAFENASWLDWASAYFGVLRAGGVAVPIAPGDVPKLAKMGLCRLRLVLAGELDALPDAGAPIASVTELLQRRGLRDYALPVLTPDLEAQILCTSGTTGEPKGVVATHANLTFGHPTEVRSEDLTETTGLGTNEWPVAVHAFPIGSNAAQVALLSPLFLRQTLVVLPRFEPRSFADAVESCRARAALLTPTMASWLLRAGVPEKADLSSLSLILLTGSHTPHSLLQALCGALPHCRLVNVYTTTEAYPATVSMEYDPARPQSVGLADNSSAIMVTDEMSSPLPAGEEGMVWLRSDAPTRRYLDDIRTSQDQQLASWTAEGWVATGDRGYRDQEGFLYLTGRSDDVVKVGGLKVSTQEVEDALLQHPAISEVAVVAQRDAHLGYRLSAFIVLSSPADERVLRAFARSRLPSHKVPALIQIVDHLPRTRTGKVLKHQVTALNTGPASTQSASLDD